MNMDKSEINDRIAKILGYDGDIEDLIKELKENKDSKEAFSREGWKMALEETKSVREEAKAENERKIKLIGRLIIVILVQFLVTVGLLFGLAVWFFNNVEVVDNWEWEISHEFSTEGGDIENSGNVSARGKFDNSD